MDIYQIISNGENSRTEFKTADFRNDSLAKEIAAFSNMSGCEIFIGISDTGMIDGVEDKQIEERVIHICRNNIIPPVIPEISFIHAEGKKNSAYCCGKRKIQTIQSQILRQILHPGRFSIH